MAYRLPSFNSLMNWWMPGNTPLAGPPDVANVPSQLYFYSRNFADTTPGAPHVWDPATYVRIGIATVVVLGLPMQGGILGFTDANGTTWYCKVVFWSHVHLGFPNEYVALLVEQCDAGGVSPDSGR
jgi:hypothetical protein